MSRFFDALKRMERWRAPGAEPVSATTNGNVQPDRRRSRRRTLDVPVYVYTHDSDQEPCHEEAHTLNVNEEGALLLLSVPVFVGQQLVLTNAITEADQFCQVVRLGTRRSRTVETGVAFVSPHPGFWPLPKEEIT